MLGNGLYHNNFSIVFSRLLKETGVSCYEICQYTDLDEGYLSRLKSGKKSNPSVETIVKISLAMAHFSSKFSIYDAESLFNAVGRFLVPKSTSKFV